MSELFISSILYTEGTQKINEEIVEDLKKKDPPVESAIATISKYQNMEEDSDSARRNE